MVLAGKNVYNVKNENEKKAFVINISEITKNVVLSCTLNFILMVISSNKFRHTSFLGFI